MSKICRTCLQKSNQTFSTNQILGEFDGGAVKISLVLRFCIPELYLGLSSNPQICYNCREDLKVAYLFKKKCLNTENIIGNFLKNLRCTAKSVELYDVVAYLNESAKLQLEAEKTKRKIILNAQDILSEWEDHPDDEAVSSERDSCSEVRQSAPNPTNSKDTSSQIKFCEQTGLFVSRQGEYFDCTGKFVSKGQQKPDTVKNHREKENLTSHNDTDLTSLQVKKKQTESTQDGEYGIDNFFKITSVYSLSETAENTNVDHDNTNNVDCVNDKNSVIGDNDTNKDTLVIKSEPLDVEPSGERAGFNNIPTDEDTLDASETASYNDPHRDANLQGIIDNIPEINDDNQYVDVPEFVHINNFGLKELEELRQQQIKETEQKKKEENTILNFENKIPTANKTFNSFDLTSTDLKPKDIKSGSVVVKSSKDLPETLFLNGKKMVKCAGGYRMVQDSSPLLKSILKSGNAVTQATVGTQVENSKYVKPVTFDEMAFKKIPEVLFIEGKKYIKSNEKKGFKIVSEPEEGTNLIQMIVSEPEEGTNLIQIKTAAAGKVQDMQKNPILPAFLNADPGSNTSSKNENISNNAESQETSLKLNVKKTVDSRPIMRRRIKRLKIVSVNDVKSLPKKKSTAPKLSDRDIVVLFTNYTMDGLYINDHDYLVNPYKRNKILLEGDDEWLCMCYICHTKHHIYDHVHHMTGHGRVCKFCRVDLGTPYMLNVHVKGHTKPCRMCTERVPYGLMESHEQKHLVEEVEFEKYSEKEKKIQYRKRRLRTEKPICFKIQQPDQSGDASLEEFSGGSLGNVTSDEVNSNSERKQRGRKRKNRSEHSPTVERSFRVLRSNVRKSYNETDDLDDVRGSDSVEDT